MADQQDSPEKTLSPEAQALLQQEQTRFQNQTLQAQLQIALTRVSELVLENHQLRNPDSPEEG